MKLLTTLLCMSLSVALSTNISHAAEPPNIILILIDGLGRDSVSAYGSDQATPNMDQLARDGVRYETVWSMPACNPTRVTLLTGQYPFRHGWTEHRNAAELERNGLSWEQFPTVAKRLHEGGYQTAIGGHWQVNHLGKQAGALRKHGFYESCVWDPSDLEENGHDESGTPAHLLINGNREKVENGSERINTFLTDFTARNRNRPFFIYYPMLLNSAMLHRSNQRDHETPSKKTVQHATSVKHADQLVGNLISAVDRNGLREKTVILLTGKNLSAIDNRKGQARQPPHSDRISDHGVHVPLIVRAVGMSSAGRVSQDLIDVSDFYPTFVELADLELPDHAVLDGRSFVPSLRGSEDPYEKRNWIYSQLGKTRMIRDWQHVIDNHGNFHDLQKDPLQQQKVSPLDKIAPGRRQRLQMILDRFPGETGGPPPEDTSKD